MVNSEHDRNEVIIEKKGHDIEKSANGTDNGVIPSFVDNGAWLEMENTIGSHGNNQKIRKKPSVLLCITPEEFQTNATMPKVAKNTINLKK